MDWKKFLRAGFVGGFVIAFVSLVVGKFVQMVWPYDVLSLGGMRAAGDPIMILFFLHYWVLAFALAYVWRELHVFFPGEKTMQGKRFGLLMWVAVSIPQAFIVYSSMDYPIGFTVQSLVGSFLYMIAAGVTIVRLME
jgi:hypothetical protein